MKYLIMLVLVLAVVGGSAVALQNPTQKPIATFKVVGTLQGSYLQLQPAVGASTLQ